MERAYENPIADYMKKLVLSIAFSFTATVSQAGWFPIPLTDNGSYDGPDGHGRWFNGRGSYAGNDGSYETWDRNGWTYDGPDGTRRGSYAGKDRSYETWDRNGWTSEGL
jgi:hypothetical protein